MTNQLLNRPNDLVLRIDGGERNGKFIAIKSEKCLLDFRVDAFSPEAKCAVFRGPVGVAVCSLGDQVLINGAPTSVHWLQAGDRLEFPNSISAVVTQLGTVERAVEQLNEAFQADETSVAARTKPKTDAFGIPTDGSAQPGIQWPTGFGLPAAQNVVVETPAAGAQEKPLPQVNAPQPSSIETPSEASFQAAVEAPTPSPTFQTPVGFTETEEEEKVFSPIDFAAQAPAEPDSLPETTSDAAAFETSEPDPETENSRADESLNQRMDELISRLAIPSKPAPTPQAPAPAFEAPAFEAPAPQAPAPAFEAPAVPTPTFEQPSNEVLNHEPVQSVAPVANDAPSVEDAIKAAFANLTADASPTTSTEAAVIQEPIAPAFTAPEPVVQAPLDTVQPVPPELAHPSFDETTNFYQPAAEETAAQESIVGYQEATEAIHAEPHSEANHFEIEVVDAQVPAPAPQEIPNQHTADETVGESIDNLTHSSLMDGPSSAVETPSDSQNRESLEAPSFSSEAAIQATEEPVETSQEQEAAKNESVAELLERMKAEGQWGGVPDDDEPTSSFETVAAEPTPAPVPPTPAAEPEEVDEDDVEGYMSRLLSRMRGGNEPAKPKVVVEQPKKEKVEAKQDADYSEAPSNPLKPDEFVPLRKAQPIESLSAMRELANSTARSAVQQSEESRRKALGALQVAIAIASFGMSLYYIFFGSARIGDLSFGVGVVCFIIAGFLGFRFYNTMLYNEQVDAEEKAAKKRKAEDAQPTA